MESLNNITIDFETSHLIFPKLIAIVLIVLGLAIVILRRRSMVNVGKYWSNIYQQMDKFRFFGTLLISVIYFLLMIPIGDIWPNTGLGFLLCSIPFIFLSGYLYMEKDNGKNIKSLLIVAIIVPVLIWWLFTNVFYLTLP